MMFEIVPFIYQFSIATALVIGFWLFGGVVKIILGRIAQKMPDGVQAAVYLLGRIIGALIFILGLLTALGTVGVDVTAVVTGLGITGFAAGFAFKDAFSNVLAGIMILLYRPFKRNDIIEIDGQRGQVKQIDLRYIALKQDSQTVLIPNTLALSKIVKIQD